MIYDRNALEGLLKKERRREGTAERQERDEGRKGEVIRVKRGGADFGEGELDDGAVSALQTCGHVEHRRRVRERRHKRSRWCRVLEGGHAP